MYLFEENATVYFPDDNSTHAFGNVTAVLASLHNATQVSPGTIRRRRHAVLHALASSLGEADAVPRARPRRVGRERRADSQQQVRELITM